MSKGSAYAKTNRATGFTRTTSNLLKRQQTVGPHLCVQGERGNSTKVPQSVHDVLRTPGQPLDPTIRTDMESRFGAELSGAPYRGATSSATPQPLSIGPVGDAHELEADRIADTLLRNRAPAPRQTTSAATRRQATSAESPQFDFSHVRVHAGEKAAEAARGIDASAFTVGSHLVFGREAYAPETVAGSRILSHELAHVFQNSRSGGDVATVRRFASFTDDEQTSDNSLGWKHPEGAVLRVSDDGEMAAEDKGWGPGTNKRAWTTARKVAEANSILANQNSRAQLQAKGGGKDISGKAPASGSTSTLQEIEPFKAGGGPINLASDCGTACRQIMGSGGTDVAVIKKEPSAGAGSAIGGAIGLAALGAAGAGIGYAAAGPSQRGLGAAVGAAIGGIVGLVGGIVGGGAIGKAASSKEEALTPRTYHGGHPRTDQPTTPEEWSEELFKKEFGQNLSRQEALAAYDNLSPEKKDAFDRKYGINKYAVPRVGQGITIGTEYDMPGYADPTRSAWNFHYAAAVLSSGPDYITLESAAGWQPEDWIFFMYGPASKGQSFYEEQRATGTHGTKNTALVVQPNQ